MNEKTKSGEELLKDFSREYHDWLESDNAEMPTSLINASNQLTGYIRRLERDHQAMEILRRDNPEDTVWSYEHSHLFRSYSRLAINVTGTPAALDPADAILKVNEIRPDLGYPKPERPQTIFSPNRMRSWKEADDGNLK